MTFESTSIELFRPDEPGQPACRGGDVGPVVEIENDLGQGRGRVLAQHGGLVIAVGGHDQQAGEAFCRRVVADEHQGIRGTAALADDIEEGGAAAEIIEVFTGLERRR